MHNIGVERNAVFRVMAKGHFGLLKQVRIEPDGMRGIKVGRTPALQFQRLHSFNAYLARDDNVPACDRRRFPEHLAIADDQEDDGVFELLQ